MRVVTTRAAGNCLASHTHSTIDFCWRHPAGNRHQGESGKPHQLALDYFWLLIILPQTLSWTISLSRRFLAHGRRQGQRGRGRGGWRNKYKEDNKDSIDVKNNEEKMWISYHDMDARVGMSLDNLLIMLSWKLVSINKSKRERHQIKPDSKGYQEVKEFWDPSTYSREKRYFTFVRNFGTHCSKRCAHPQLSDKHMHMQTRMCYVPPLSLSLSWWRRKEWWVVYFRIAH